MKQFSILEGLALDTQPSFKRLKICFVTPELAEFYQNGGIGTATSGLVQTLHKEGHDITIFYTGDAPTLEKASEDRAWKATVSGLTSKGIHVEFLLHSYGPEYQASPRKISYACYDYVKSQSFDVIHFNDYGGNGFYAALARKAGVALHNSKIITTIHGPTLWAVEANFSGIADLGTFERSWMEHRAIENSDIVVGVSAHLLDWLIEKDVKLPSQSFVHKNCHPRLEESAGAPIMPGGLKRVAFFGRHELRKGIDIFVEAVSRFGRGHPEVEIAFVGKFGNISGEHSAGYILHRLQSLPNKVTFYNSLDRDSGLRELGKAGTLAVMPSHDENSPCVVVECQTMGIPFLAADVGGVSELVNEADQEAVLFKPDVETLLERLENVSKNGQPVVRPNRTAEQIETLWAQLHRALVDDETPELPSFGADAPLVSVCVTHFRRAHLLEGLIAAIEAQDYPNIEIVLVDDCSADHATMTILDALEAREAPRFPLKIVRRSENGYLGAARNSAIAASSGVFVKFQDDDNLPLVHEISSMVRAAQNLGVEAVTAFSYWFSDEIPEVPSFKDVKYFSLGGCAPLAYLRNEFGDANALISRRLIDAVGGFTEDYGVGAEDYELFAKILSQGEEVVSLPEPLYWYRVNAGSMLQTGPVYKNALRGHRGFDKMPLERIKPLLDMQFFKIAQEEEKGRSRHRVGAYRHGRQHQALLIADPNSIENTERVEELMGLYGRTEEAFMLAMQSRPFSKAVEWLKTAMHRPERGESDLPLMIALNNPQVKVEAHLPLEQDVPNDWKKWRFINCQWNGLLVHPIKKMMTEAHLPQAIPAGARTVTVKWIHGGQLGRPVEVSIGLTEGLESEWATLEGQKEGVVQTLTLPADQPEQTLRLRSRAIGTDAGAHAVAQFVKVDFI